VAAIIHPGACELFVFKNSCNGNDRQHSLDVETAVVAGLETEGWNFGLPRFRLPTPEEIIQS
jgi:hypothetical protein